MAKISVLYKLNPSSPGEDMARKIVDEANKILNEMGLAIHDKKIEPLAFGLYSATILIVVDEEDEDKLNEIERLLSQIDGVNSVENVGMTRL